MKRGAVVVDVAIDQGGCFETSHATTHANPTYEVDGVIHYCVANMPGSVPLTSSQALNNATLPFGLALAGDGVKAMLRDPHLKNGLNVHRGHDHASGRGEEPRPAVPASGGGGQAFRSEHPLRAVERIPCRATSSMKIPSLRHGRLGFADGAELVAEIRLGGEHAGKARTLLRHVTELVDRALHLVGRGNAV